MNYLLKTVTVAAFTALCLPAMAQHKPVAGHDAVSVTVGSSVNFNVLANDTHPHGKPLDVISYSALTGGAGILVKNPNKSFTFTPIGVTAATITFTYAIKAEGNCPPTPHTYQYVPAPGISWAAAKAQAEAMGGYLATITCPEENLAVKAVFSEPANAWMGGSDAEEEGVWKWLTGPEAGQQFSLQDLTNLEHLLNGGFLLQLPERYHNWGSYEPNSEGLIWGNEEDYNHFNSYNGYWNDMNGAGNALIHGFVVEYGGVNQLPEEYMDTATVTITVNPLPASILPTLPTVCLNPVPSITVNPANNTFTGGVPTNIYLGYGPQSVTLTAGSGMLGSCTYSWSVNGTVVSNSQSLNVAPTVAGDYNYTVTCTKFGCSKSKSVQICVKDVRVPNNNGKVYVCHIPPGNPSNAHTLSISTNAVSAHVGLHGGDKLGTCSMVCGSALRVSADEKVIDVDEHFELKAYPNPNTGTFQVDIPYTEGQTTIKIYDVHGKVVGEKLVTENDGYSIRFNMEHLSKGIYFIEVANDNRRLQTRMIIQ